MMKELKLKRIQAGAEIVEFAVILPFLLLVMFGIMEFGLVFYDKALITNASREAARSGIAYKCPVLSADEIKAVSGYSESNTTDIDNELWGKFGYPVDCYSHLQLSVPCFWEFIQFICFRIY